MEPIYTIEDYKNADPKDLAVVARQITIKDDLFKYLAWLNSPDGGRLEGKFELGYNAHRGLGLHPSVVSKKGTCPLRLYYDVTGDVEARPNIGSRLQLTFDIGTMLHVMLQTFLLDMYGDQFREEVRLKDKRLYIVSSTDGEFKWPLVRFLLEIKTIKEGGSYGIDRVRSKPLADHLRQLHMYMKLADCPFGLVFYLCKNTSEVIEHLVMWDDDIWNEIKHEIDPVISAVQIGKPPTPKTGRHCHDCPYFHGCHWGKEFLSGGSAKRAAQQRGAAIRRRNVRPRRKPS